jgi:hypothetical protein
MVFSWFYFLVNLSNYEKINYESNFFLLKVYEILFDDYPVYRKVNSYLEPVIFDKV